MFAGDSAVNGPGRSSFMTARAQISISLFCSSSSARLQLSQKSSKKLKKKTKGSTVLMCWKEGIRKQEKKVNKVYKAILTGNTSDS